MKITGILTLLLLTAQMAFAGFGEINGRVTDESGEPVFSAHVVLKFEGQPVHQTFTDVQGFYTLKPIENGTYDLEVSFVSFQPQVINDISVSDGQIRVVDVKLSTTILDETVITVYKDLVDPGYPIKISIVTAKEIENSAASPLDYIVVSSSNVYQEDYGDPIQFRGARPEGTLYIIDGVKIMGEPGVVRNSIEDMAIYSGGIPAKYGDATGGIVVITTKSYKKLR